MAKLGSNGAKAKVSPPKPASQRASGNQYSKLVRPSSEFALLDDIFVLYGDGGVGKTFMAATASQHWAPSGKRDLKDMFWVSIDGGATAGFTSQGITVPEVRLLDLQRDPKMWKEAGFTQAPTITQAASWAVGHAAERAKAGLTEWLVIDTLSFLDRDALIHHEKKTAGDPNSYAKYQLNLGFHDRFRLAIRMAGIKTILCCHSREAKPNEASKYSFSAGSQLLVPRLTGDSASVYMGNVSLEVYIQKRVNPKGEVSRTAWTVNKHGACKNRWADLLAEQEPADMGVILGKIRRGIGR